MSSLSELAKQIVVPQTNNISMIPRSVSKQENSQPISTGVRTLSTPITEPPKRNQQFQTTIVPSMFTDTKKSPIENLIKFFYDKDYTTKAIFYKNGTYRYIYLTVGILVELSEKYRINVTTDTSAPSIEFEGAQDDRDYECVLENAKKKLPNQYVFGIVSKTNLFIHRNTYKITKLSSDLTSKPLICVVVDVENFFKSINVMKGQILIMMEKFREDNKVEINSKRTAIKEMLEKLTKFCTSDDDSIFSFEKRSTEALDQSLQKMKLLDKKIEKLQEYVDKKILESTNEVDKVFAERVGREEKEKLLLFKKTVENAVYEMSKSQTSMVCLMEGTLDSIKMSLEDMTKDTNNIISMYGETKTK